MGFIYITVALGKSRYALRRGRRLQKLIEKFDKEISLEQPEQDASQRWTYTFESKQAQLQQLRQLLHDNGRFKIVRVRTVDGEEIEAAGRK
jgi:hypothetical protein